MQLGQAARLDHGTFAVLAIPSSLTFYADEQASHKQVISLYNIYGRPIYFKVYCNASRKYVVFDAHGSIKSECYIEIWIQHRAISPANYGVVDKFRIQVFSRGDNKLIGRGEVTATLLANKPDEDANEFEQMGPPSLPHVGTQQYSFGVPSQAAGGTRSNLRVVVLALAAMFCIAALMLPTDGVDESSLVPSHLHLTVNQKIGFSFALGLFAMAILR